MIVRIDNLTRIVYNKKKLWCFFIKALPATLCFFALLIYWGAVLSPLACGGYRAVSEVYPDLNAKITDDGKYVEAEIFLEPGVEICGMSAEICFDSDILGFYDARVGNAFREKMSFDYSHTDGMLRFVIDGEQDCTEGALAVFCFELIDRSVIENSLISLSLEKGEAFSFCNGALVSVDVPDVTVELNMQREVISVGKFPEIAEMRTLKHNGKVKLELVGLADSKCFAAGFEVWITDILDSRTEHYSICGVLDAPIDCIRGFGGTFEIPETGWICVILRPMAYYAREVSGGDEVVYFFIDGRRYDINIIDTGSEDLFLVRGGL